ncbi:hypothetical protein [Massilia sp. Leaf139]|uniref:hypothetical protein n=1 Tax=Massilia sp. Leaf139 TaxID=1736272 RepID=UPI0007020D5B|nr:hypothetical protein [Massilia sp. Leaf139]KQQ87221.1 hypothetical protein ASF77_16670 [Massilia sp. Leaf139]
MLHAFDRHKSSFHIRYLGVKDELEPRVSSEDEITSLVFGPMDFLSPADNWRCWETILNHQASRKRGGLPPPDFFAPSFTPTACTLLFWPKKDKVEPDLHIVFSDTHGTRRSLLVELKWNAPLSGDDQLEKQWERYHEGEHAHSLHVFIAKRVEELQVDETSWACLGEGGAAASRLRLLSWHEFRHEIEGLGAAPDLPVPLRRWCRLTSHFLLQVGIRPFVGFGDSIRLADAFPLAEGDPVTFWHGNAPSTTF